MTVAHQHEPQAAHPARQARAILLGVVALCANAGCGQGLVRKPQENWLEATVHPRNYRHDPSTVILTASLLEKETPRALPGTALPPPLHPQQLLLAACEATRIPPPARRGKRGGLAGREGSSMPAANRAVPGPVVWSEPAAAPAAAPAAEPERTRPMSGILAPDPLALIEACRVTKIPPPVPFSALGTRDAGLARTTFARPGQRRDPAPAEPVQDSADVQAATAETTIPPAIRRDAEPEGAKEPLIVAVPEPRTETGAPPTPEAAPEQDSLKAACDATKIPPPAPPRKRRTPSVSRAAAKKRKAVIVARRDTPASAAAGDSTAPPPDAKAARRRG